MPIYKISKRGSSEQRTRVVFGRVRLVAVLLSGLLLSVTILLLLLGGH